MAGVDFTYDTREIRRSAGQIRECLNRVEKLRSQSVGQVRSAVSGSFAGEAADALDERLDAAQRELNEMASQLSVLYAGVLLFVQRLEELDAELAQQMNG